MHITQNIQRLRELIDNAQPIWVPDLVNASFAPRLNIWRMGRAGMPVIRIEKRLFVRFSDLTNAHTCESQP